MLILGLGSNLGDSLNNLRLTVQLLQKLQVITLIQVSPIYSSSALLPSNAPVAWNRPYLNVALKCESDLVPSELLSAIKQIEKFLGREESKRWAPRVIDIDILAWDDLIINDVGLKIPHPELEHRPFALWPLLDLLPTWKHPEYELNQLVQQWGSRFLGQAPFNTRQLPHLLEGTRLVGIINLTPDSFSDGGKFINVPNALSQAEKLVFEGAEILDLGAESTRPGAIPVAPNEEWKRLAPILSALKERRKAWPIKVKLSVDTRHYQIAEKAIDLGIDWINDVSGFNDSKMRKLAAESGVMCVTMHNLGIPANKEITLPPQSNICVQILDWAKQRFNELTVAGINPEQFIFDIGIGFGKTAHQSAFLLKNIKQFKSLKFPLLVGHSRKSFLSLITDKPFVERDFETALLSFQLTMQGVDYIRVHNVGLSARALNCTRYLKEASL